MHTLAGEIRQAKNLFNAYSAVALKAPYWEWLDHSIQIECIIRAVLATLYENMLNVQCQEISGSSFFLN